MTAETGTMPVRKTLVVGLDAGAAFELFTARLGEWWPTATHSIHGERVAEVVVEGRAGGRIFERSVDGEETHWARILDWQPPRRLLLEWQVDPRAAAPTEIEVTFTPEEAGTRVELEHRGWERLGAAGDKERRSYEPGWDVVLGGYEKAAGAA